jgi:hypothetical protein
MTVAIILGSIVLLQFLLRDWMHRTKQSSLRH